MENLMLFQRSTGKVLDPQELGFKTLDGMLLSIMDKYLNLKYVGNGKWSGLNLNGCEWSRDGSAVTQESPTYAPLELYEWGGKNLQQPWDGHEFLLDIAGFSPAMMPRTVMFMSI